jgi:hypothetical protein
MRSQNKCTSNYYHCQQEGGKSTKEYKCLRFVNQNCNFTGFLANGSRAGGPPTSWRFGKVVPATSYLMCWTYSPQTSVRPFSSPMPSGEFCP